jgi:AbrB family looped-hinge helix DNA binding protein
MAVTVKLSSKYQVVIPQSARRAMALSAGDELLVLAKPDRVVMVRKPRNFTKHMAGLHRNVWRGADGYLNEERASW